MEKPVPQKSLRRCQPMLASMFSSLSRLLSHELQLRIPKTIMWIAAGLFFVAFGAHGVITQRISVPSGAKWGGIGAVIWGLIVCAVGVGAFFVAYHTYRSGK